MYCVVPSVRGFVRTSDLPTFLPSRDIKHRTIQYGELAQLGERLVCNQEVTGSSPVFSTLFTWHRPPADAPCAGARVLRSGPERVSATALRCSSSRSVTNRCDTQGAHSAPARES